MSNDSSSTSSQPSSSKGSRVVLSVGELAIVFGIYIVAQVVVALVLGLTGASGTIRESPAQLLVAYVLASSSVGGALYLVMKVRAIPFGLLKFHTPRLSDIGYALGAYVVYFLTATVLFGLLRLIPGLELDQQQDIGLSDVSGLLLGFTFIALVIAAPLSEELLFRGYLYHRLKAHWGTRLVPALATSVLFGLVHGQLNVAVDTFLLSMVMIYLVEKRDSLWPAIFLHMTKNAIAFTLLFVLDIV